MKQLTLFANEQECKDFELIKTKLERKSNGDTIRAMISLCKKILSKNINISTNNPN